MKKKYFGQIMSFVKEGGNTRKNTGLRINIADIVPPVVGDDLTELDERRVRENMSSRGEMTNI